MADLSTKQTQAIRALLMARTAREAAKNTGIPERTLYRWMSLPIFATALRQAERDAIGAAVRWLAGDMQSNFELMQIIRDDIDIPAMVRLRAAMALDDAHRRWREIADIEERLERLESLIDDIKATNR